MVKENSGITGQAFQVECRDPLLGEYHKIKQMISALHKHRSEVQIRPPQTCRSLYDQGIFEGPGADVQCQSMTTGRVGYFQYGHSWHRMTANLVEGLSRKGRASA